jgi:hypothetical protein
MAAIISNNTQGSTEATQIAVKADLDTVVTNTTGLATAAAQTIGNNSLAQIVTNTTGLSNPTSSFIHSDTISTVAVGVTQDAGAGNLVKCYSIVSKGTGAAPTLLSCNLEVSLDGTNWTVLMTITQASDGQMNGSGSTLFPARYFRSNVTSITLGGASNVVVTVAAMK